jgi:hypothetical protein
MPVHAKPVRFCQSKLKLTKFSTRVHYHVQYNTGNAIPGILAARNKTTPQG